MKVLLMCSSGMSSTIIKTNMAKYAEKAGIDLVVDSKESILAFIAGIISPVFAPLGLGDWRICTSLISGFIAKESVVSVLGVLFVDGVENSLSTVTAITLLVFSLLYTPCVAAIAAIKRELGKKWAIAVVLWQCAVAWIVAFAVRLVALLIIR